MIVRMSDPRQADEAELRAFHKFLHRIEGERRPNDPPQTFEAFLARLRNVPPIFKLIPWGVWNDDQTVVLAMANLIVPLMGENKHLARFDIMVLPEERRRGIGTALLVPIVERMHALKRTLLVTESLSTIPAGAEFLRAIGACIALEAHAIDLNLEEVDRTLLRSWISEAQEQASEFAMGWWIGTYPEERIDEVAAMLEAQNTVPLGSFNVEKMHFTPDHIRAMEETRIQAGIDRWTCYVEDRASGKIAGFTQIFLPRAQPETLDQGLTAVLEPYRNRGLGRWLKAAMVERVLEELPAARTIKSRNADVNEAMLSINLDMGFRPAMAKAMWQVKVDDVERYIQASPVHAGLLTPA